MDREIVEHAAEVLKAVAHPVRLQVIEALEHQEHCVGEMMEALDLQQAVLSQQLRIMRDKGVLSTRREGTKVYYRIVNPNVIKLLHCMYDHCQAPTKQSE